MEQPPDYQVIITSALADCENAEDVVMTLMSFFDPEVMDGDDRQDIVGMGVEKIKEICNCSTEEATQIFNQTFKTINEANNTIN